MARIDKKYLNKQINIVVQINGKKRGLIETEAAAEQDRAFKRYKK